MKISYSRTPPVIIALALMVALGATFYPRPITFNVISKTEILSATVSQGARSRWQLSGVQLQRNCEDEAVEFTGSLELAASTRIQIQRITTGPMRILLVSESNDGAGDLYDNEEEFLETLADCSTIVVHNLRERAEKGETLFLPITGEVEIGHEVRFQTTSSSPLLKSATISMLSQPLVGKSHFDVGKIQLDMGDVFTVKDPITSAFGFVLVDASPGMSGVFRLKGTTGQVIRFGAEGYLVQTPLWVKLANDPILTGIWIVFLFLLKYIGLVAKWLNGGEANA